ncbi:hypothetical protein I305_00473 [Cryptococcus gattii E566]|uniref:Uncharacterized protein n=2 Tax=Cryptococcus gattii TaxID=37769 RepID=E6QYQ0_CRYGW|nr:Hypothetical protein CGB_A9160W [Cryptococcus gattii WM276]ADV19958.1 Hypothetical protein CGB_A9160W [Cryptococcus gattii WM276]KIY37375.1 hypothetical protein I305_00473 [Cryptococcus gattii E566]KJE02661.1 hypothetical protein I311_03636 [Cryptococcus gattii NT-10]
MAMWIALTITRPFDPCFRRDVMVTIWKAERTPKATNSKRSSIRPTAAHLREARKANSKAIRTAKAERTMRKILFALPELSHNLILHQFLHPAWLREQSDLHSNFAPSVDRLISEYSQVQYQHTTLYWLKKFELSGKRVVRNGLSFSNNWRKNKLHCGNTVCEPDERLFFVSRSMFQLWDVHIHPNEPNGSSMLITNSFLIDNVLFKRFSMVGKNVALGMPVI